MNVKFSEQKSVKSMCIRMHENTFNSVEGEAAATQKINIRFFDLSL